MSDGPARRRGSWPALVALGAAFLLAFWWQRGRSRFLRIEAERPAAAALADELGVDVADALAVRDLVGPEAPVARWREVVAAFASARASSTPRHAAAAVAPDPVAARRLLLLRERFAARH